MTDQNYIIKISTALSNKPFFVKIANPDLSINTIVNEAIDNLKNSGHPLQATQLTQLYKKHQIYNGGKQISKGLLFRELDTQQKLINNQQTIIAELDLVTRHSGG